MKQTTKINQKIITIEQLLYNVFYVSKYDIDRQKETEKVVLNCKDLAKKVYQNMIDIEFEKTNYQF